MTAEELWQDYCEKNKADANTPHSVWCFGGDADALAELVRNGTKTATCSWFDLYALCPEEPMPKSGDISVVLNGKDEAVCIIRDTRVYTAVFREVTAEHAFKEGEGDRSLDYWRRVHVDFFRGEAREYGLVFDEDIRVLCEEFEVLYRT